jgi:choline transport protein
MATTAYATSQQIEGLIALNSPSYVIKGWHGTLFSIAITVFAIIWNTVLIRKLPLLEGMVLTLHVFGFFAFVVVLWVMGPRSPAKEIFTEFQDNSGWGNVWLSCLVGILGPVVTLIGSDSSCHLSEELRDAAWVLPRYVFSARYLRCLLPTALTSTFVPKNLTRNGTSSSFKSISNLHIPDQWSQQPS